MPRYVYENVFSNMHPGGYILGIIIGAVLFMVLYNLLGVKRYNNLLSKIGYTMTAIMVSSVFILLFFAFSGILGKTIVVLFFSLILFAIYRNKLRSKRNFIRAKKPLKKRSKRTIK